MKNVIRLAIVDPNDVTRSTLKHLLLGIDTVWLEAECSNYEYFADVALQTQPDIALVSLDNDPDKGLELVARVSAEVPSCNTLVVGRLLSPVLAQPESSGALLPSVRRSSPLVTSFHQSLQRQCFRG